jgi:hypothetical protein
MYIRDVPNHLWSEVVAYCKEQGLIRRDFIELAINTLKQKQPKDDQSAGLVEAEQTAKAIERRLQVYERLANLQNKISELKHPIGLMETGLDETIKSRMRVDFQNMKDKLMQEMDSLLPEVEIETPPVEMPLSKPDSETTDERLERMMRTVREMTGLHSDCDSEECANKAEVVENEETIEEENSIENPIDEFLIAGKEKDGTMVFGEKATPERKAEIESIGIELEKRKKKRGS